MDSSDNYSSSPSDCLSESFDWPSSDDPDQSPCFNSPTDEFLDLEELQFLSVEGVDKQRRRILRIVGKFFPAPVVDSSRLKDYILHKISRELSDEQFCVAYFHTRAKMKENCPGLFNLRWIYETLPREYRDRLEAVYFVHPGLLSRTIMGTIGRVFLSDRFYQKVNYISRIEFLWDHIKKGQLEVPEFIFEHDEELEHRPLMDYWLESDPMSSCSMSGLQSHQPMRWTP